MKTIRKQHSELTRISEDMDDLLADMDASIAFMKDVRSRAARVLNRVSKQISALEDKYELNPVGIPDDDGLPTSWKKKEKHDEGLDNN